MSLPTSAYADEGTAPDGAPLAFTVHGTTLRLSVREAQVVRVEAFDVLGRRVATLVEAALGAGETRELRLEAGHLAAGVYVLRATGATAARSRPVVVR